MYGGALSMIYNIVTTGIRTMNRSAAKPKNKCEELGIDLASKQLAWRVVGTCVVR